MALEFTTSYLKDALSVFRAYKKLGDGAMAQVTDDQLRIVLDADMNSIAQIVKHMAGNMRSRWTDFLTTDGEKPNRQRETEFADPPATRAAVLALWESGWQLVFAGLEPLSDNDLERVVSIRGERHSVMQAVNRQMAHYAYHVGQIVLLAKHFSGREWRSLSIPKGGSARYEAQVRAGEASQR